MPIHMAGAEAPVEAWGAKVSQRNAPGAMSAMAFMVRPVRPRVGFISEVVFSGIDTSLGKWIADRRGRVELFCILIPVKTMGGLLLLAGWLLVLCAVRMLADGMARNAFVAAGLGVEVLGLVVAVRAH